MFFERNVFIEPPLTIAQLKKDNYQAYTRNKLIAEAFYLAGDIEKYGSGFIRIRDEIKKYPTMQFNFEEAPNGFLVALNYTQQKERLAENVTQNVTQNRLDAIIHLIQNENKITTAAIAKKLQLSKRTILRDIEKLKATNKINYVGAAKGGYWKILKNEV